MKRACSTLTQKPSARISPWFVDVSVELLEHLARPDIVGGVEPVETLDVVAAAAPPGDVAQVEAVVDAVVDEGRQAVLVDGVPQAQLGGDAVVEPMRAAAGRRCARAWR